jgi:hypothetical protein
LPRCSPPRSAGAPPRSPWFATRDAKCLAAENARLKADLDRQRLVSSDILVNKGVIVAATEIDHLILGGGAAAVTTAAMLRLEDTGCSVMIPVGRQKPALLSPGTVQAIPVGTRERRTDRAPSGRLLLGPTYRRTPRTAFAVWNSVTANAAALELGGRPRVVRRRPDHASAG